MTSQPAGKTGARKPRKPGTGAGRKGRRQAPAARGPGKPRGARRRRVLEIAEALPDGREMLATPLPDIRHERFCQALLTEPSQAAAAVRAGYASGPACQQASRLLTNANIQRRVAYLLADAAREGILSRKAVLRNASARAAGMIADFADLMRLPWGRFCEAVREHPCARAIKRVKRKVEYDAASKTWSEPFVEEIELFDPRSSERLLADILGWDAPKQVQAAGDAGKDEAQSVDGGKGIGEFRVPRGVIYLPMPILAPRGDVDDGGGASGG